MRATSVTVIAAVAAGILGGVVGSLLTDLDRQRAGPASNHATTHDQDVVLCTSYALIVAALHHPLGAPDALPAIAPLRLALTENPDATPPVRDAITQAVEAFDAVLAKEVKPQGLSEPPAYDQARVSAAFDRVVQVCGLQR